MPSCDEQSVNVSSAESIKLSDERRFDFHQKQIVTIVRTYPLDALAASRFRQPITFTRSEKKVWIVHIFPQNGGLRPCTFCNWICCSAWRISIRGDRHHHHAAAMLLALLHLQCSARCLRSENDRCSDSANQQYCDSSGQFGDQRVSKTDPRVGSITPNAEDLCELRDSFNAANWHTHTDSAGVVDDLHNSLCPVWHRRAITFGPFTCTFPTNARSQWGPPVILSVAITKSFTAWAARPRPFHQLLTLESAQARADGSI